MVRLNLKDKKTIPQYKFLLKGLNSWDYFLTNDFNEAVITAIKKSVSEDDTIEIYERRYHAYYKDWRTRVNFYAIDGKIKYDEVGKDMLHFLFYIESGEWINPNEEHQIIL